MKEFKITPVKSSILNVDIDKIKDNVYNDNGYNNLSYEEIIEINKRLNKRLNKRIDNISHNYILFNFS